MKSKATIVGHPIHPMLIAFPIASYVATFAALIVYGITVDVFWFRFALVANVVGVTTAILAAIPGTVDYLTRVPKQTVARRTGAVHAIFNVAALALFSISLVVLYRDYNAGVAPALTAALILTGAGVLLTMAGGYFGFELIQHHHVGVIEAPSYGAAVNSQEALAARWMEEAPPVTDSQVIGTEDIASAGDVAGAEQGDQARPVEVVSEAEDTGRWVSPPDDGGRGTGPVDRQ
jgi:uncharacterized membrane protein